MRHPSLALLSFFALCLGATACEKNGPEAEARARLASVLRDSLGAATNPNVAFIVDDGSRDRHLYVLFDTTAFATISDSAFVVRARDIARFSLRHYGKAQALDSITVASRETLTPAEARIHHTATFAIAELRESAGRSNLPDSRMQARKVVIGANDSICASPAGPMPDGAVVGHWYANDARAHRKTFGRTPPDSSAVRLVTNSVLVSRVSRAIDSSLLALDGKRVPNSPASSNRENVYYAGTLYALVDLDQQFCGGDRTPLPIVFFLDTAWRYLGTRSN